MFVYCRVCHVRMIVFLLPIEAILCQSYSTGPRWLPCEKSQRQRGFALWAVLVLFSIITKLCVSDSHL